MPRLARLIPLMLLCSAGAWALDLSTTDGLALRMDSSGAISHIRLGGSDLPLTGPGGFYVADVARIPVHDTELLSDPGFETLAAGQPTGWNVGHDWTVDTTVAHSGKASMRVDIPGPKAASSGALAADVPVRANTSYQVSMWLRTENSAPCMYLVQTDAQGRMRADCPQTCVSHARTKSDWFQLTCTLTTDSSCRTLRVYTNIWEGTGKAWVDDVSVTRAEDDLISPQTPCRGAVQPITGGLRETCTLADRALTLTADYRAKGDSLEVAGEIADTSGKDRAVTVSFRLPLEAKGWTWFDDLEHSQPIEPAGNYGAARPFGERRTIALYPFAALGDAGRALALAVPMDQPRVFRTCYEPGKGFFINYQFGLSRDAAKLPGRASFRFAIYRTDPQWGFRSAARRYYDLFPQFFTRRLTRLGAAAFQDDLPQVESPSYYFPAGAIWDYRKRASKEAYQRELCGLCSYTEFAGWWGWAIGITGEIARRKPTPEAAWAHVEELAHANPPNDIAQCIINCAPYDRTGKPVLGDTYMADWGGYNYTCNPDPEITGPAGDVNRYRLTKAREVSQVADFGLDGLYLDCVFVSQTDNFRREHFQYADQPLAFDHVTKRPVLPLAFSVYKCAKALCDDMHARGKTVMSNYSVTDYPTDMFCIQFIDLIGNEMLYTWSAAAKLPLQRALAYQKPISMSWQEAKIGRPEAALEPEMKQAMFFGTFYHISALPPALRDRWVPVTTRLAEAGWEPITDARVAAPAKVERFGSAAAHNLHFTLRNEGDAAQEVALRLDARALHLAEPCEAWQETGGWTFERLGTTRREREWVVRLKIPAGDTAVVRIASRRDLAGDHLGAVPDLLRKAANYREALKQANVAAQCPDYETARGLAEQALTACRAGTPPAPAQLQAIADSLAAPVIGGDAADHAFWRQRLAECTAQAQARLRSAEAALR